MISQIAEIRTGVFLVAEYSKPGYWIVDRNAAEGSDPIKIEDTRTDFNSGCTNLQKIPMYEDTRLPYFISRNKFKVELIDIVDHAIYTLCEESNTSSLQPKMEITTTKHLAGHSIEVYFNC